MNDKADGIGKSSFGLIDAERLFSLLDLEDGFVFVDLACGRGDYSVAASRFVGKKGRIYSVDRWEEGMRTLKRVVRERDIGIILPILADIGKGLPLGSHRVDVCLMAAVLHDLLHAGSHKEALEEIRRILKPEGLLAIVDFKKVDGPPGPPAERKISPDEMEKLLRPHGFHQESTREIGRHHYLSLFLRAGSHG